jgi:hypothetical protein
LALICGRRAGYGVQIATQYSGALSDLYVEACTKSSIQLTTNTSAAAPTDTQEILIENVYLNQEGTNGHMIHFTADVSVGTGDVSKVNMFDVKGWVGNDTPYLYDYADATICHRCDGETSPTYWGTLFAIEFGGLSPTQLSYDNKLYDWGVASSLTVFAHGTPTIGNTTTIPVNVVSATGDFVPEALVEPGAVVQTKNDYLEENFRWINQLVVGLDLGGALFANRDVIKGTASRMYINGDVSVYGAGAHDYSYNLAYDLAKGWKYLNSDVGYVLRFEYNGKLHVMGAAAGTAGASASVADIAVFDQAKPGVTCAAGTVNPATMVITNGIVTHC